MKFDAIALPLGKGRCCVVGAAFMAARAQPAATNRGPDTTHLVMAACGHAALRPQRADGRGPQTPAGIGTWFRAAIQAAPTKGSVTAAGHRRPYRSCG